MTLRISKALLEEIRNHGLAAYPAECCGLLIGRDDGTERYVGHVIKARNASETLALNRYSIFPEDLLKADKFARERGLDIIGVYHSHPDHGAQPSKLDHECAVEHYSYVIMSVTSGAARDLNSWTFRADQKSFEREDLLIDE